MPDGSHMTARIGPNAVLQLAPAMDRIAGEGARRALFAPLGFDPLPDPTAMIDEARVAALHSALRRYHPENAREIAIAAGQGTGDYILAHRIPHAAQTLLRALPARVAAPILTRAILAHGWTFCGTGTLSARSGPPVVFTLADNPIIRGDHAPAPLCDWHAAVFEWLFAGLVHPRAHAIESACCATGAPACRFEIDWR
ncbi:bacteriochlorophyll 4-vinyl reductase [Roseovarius sp. 217]|uniref:bacteriochlorophyll 4-vinyl reductase n=1 Tax=Roseovarius sp. (strain 217) TaxID=314264 RepID=UPI000068652F|nr:bacteriochlorophyll 4-vinyl reductase [Roseovarius sp. 217]EAQ24059.1 Bacteriochlorophyll synthase, 23 kDa subunit (bchJ) [Roseovarius sp. 217]